MTLPPGQLKTIRSEEEIKTWWEDMKLRVVMMLDNKEKSA